MGPKSFTSSINGVDQDALSRYRPGLPKQLSRAIYEYHTDRGSGWFRAWDVVTGDGTFLFLFVHLCGTSVYEGVGWGMEWSFHDHNNNTVASEKAKAHEPPSYKFHTPNPKPSQPKPY